MPQGLPAVRPTAYQARPADTPAGPAGKAAALNRARSYRNPGSTGRASFAAAPIFPRAAHQRLPGPASCGMEGEGHAVPIDRAQVLGPLAVRAIITSDAGA